MLRKACVRGSVVRVRDELRVRRTCYVPASVTNRATLDHLVQQRTDCSECGSRLIGMMGSFTSRICSRGSVRHFDHMRL